MSFRLCSRRRRASAGQRWLPVPYLLFPLLILLRLPLRSDPVAAGITLNLIWIMLAAAGIWYSARAASHPRATSATRRGWRLMIVFFVLHLVGGAAIGAGMGGDASVRTISPPLVFGVACRVGQVIILFAALPTFAVRRLDRAAVRKLAMDVLTVVGGAWMFIWYVLVGPMLAGDLSGVGPALAFEGICSALSDLATIVAICTVLLRGTPLRARRPLWLLLLGVGGYLPVDLWLVFTQARAGAHLPSGLAEVALLVPSFVIMTAAIEQCRLNRAPDQPRPECLERTIQAPNSLPYLALVLGYSVLLAAAVKAGPYPWLGLVLCSLAMTVGVAVRQVIALRENYALVVTDYLTGLGNRVRLQIALDRAALHTRRSGQPLGVLAIDLNGFKEINDTYGHATGDALLATFADLLRRKVRAIDTATRLGGDEFVVILDGIADESDAAAVAERILAETRRPLLVAERPIEIGASIGIAVSDLAEPDERPEDLLRRADRAMYAVKRRGISGYRLYAPDLVDFGAAAGPPDRTESFPDQRSDDRSESSETLAR